MRFPTALSLLSLLGVALTAQTQQPASTDLLAIRNVTVIPGNGAPPLPMTTVLIRSDRIAAIAPADTFEAPAGTRIIDGTGQFLVPGFIDMHTHLSKSRASSLGLFVASGVTTVRDMGGEYEELARWRQEVTRGQRVGPRVLMAGPILESTANIERMRKDPPAERAEPFGRMRIAVGSPEEAWATVGRLALLDIDFLKVRTVHDRETYVALNQAASAHGLRLVGHAPGFPALDILEAGQDGVEHIFPRPFDGTVARADRLAVWRQYAERGVAVTPTLVSFQGGLTSRERLRTMLDDDQGAVEPRRRYVSRYLLRDWREQFLEATPERQTLLRDIWEQRLPELREMHEAGMNLLAGTDSAVLNVFPGSSLHDELALFVTAIGMSPAEALDRATRRSARFLGLSDSIGTVERGKIADLVLLDADPLRDIMNTRRIASVVLRGRLYDRTAIEQLRAAVALAPDIGTDDWGRSAPNQRP